MCAGIMEVKFVWVGLVFHGVMLLWLKEDGLPSFKKSENCNQSTKVRALLMIFVLPDLQMGLTDVFYDFDEISVGRIEAHDPCPAVISYFSGVSAAPLFVDSVDTVFDHVVLNVHSGRRTFFSAEKFVNVIRHVNVEVSSNYRKRFESKWQQTELDGLETLFLNYSSFMNDSFKTARNAMFLVNLINPQDIDESLDSVRRLLYEIRQLVKSIQFLSKLNINVLILGDKSGPFAAWGPDIVYFRNFRMTASDVAPLISGLMETAVPYDSVGVLPHRIMRSNKKREKAVSCNAQQFKIICEKITDGPFMKDLRELIPRQLPLVKLSSEDSTYWFSSFMHRLQNVFSKAKSRMNCFLFAVVFSINVAWAALLVVELASLTYPHVSKIGATNFIIHVIFGILTLAAISVPIFIKWPHSYLVYLACPFALSWAIYSRADVLVEVFKTVQWKKDVLLYLLYFTGILLLAIYTWDSLNINSIALFVGLCTITQFPMSPRFVSSPLIAKIAWWFLCLALVGALFSPEWNRPQPKLMNLCGTIWICLSGFSAFWVKPLLDSIMLVLISALTAVSMLAHSLARAPQLVDQLKYITFPIMLVPFLTFVGNRRMKNRLFHAVFSSGSLVTLTSTRLESLFFLAALLTCFLWTLMESFRLNSQLGIDTMRRAIFLAVIIGTTVAVTKTLPISYVHLGMSQLIPIYGLYRQIMISTCIMLIYLSVLRCQTHAYSSLLVVLLGCTVASIYSIVTSSNGVSLHLHGISLCTSYYLAVLFTPTFSKQDTLDLNCHNLYS